MPKVLIASYTNSLGHAGRSLELSRLLSRAGAEVIVAGGGEFDFIFPDETLSVPQVPYALLGDWLRLYLPGLPFFSLSDESGVWEPELRLRCEAFTLEALAEAWLRILKQQAPNLVVADARPEVYWASKALGIPLLGLVSFVWTELFERRYGFESEEQSERKKKRRSFGISTLLGLRWAWSRSNLAGSRFSEAGAYFPIRDSLQGRFRPSCSRSGHKYGLEWAIP